MSVIFWHRRDLRLSDNIGLASAREQSSQVIGVFCLDPGILERDDVAPARVTYLIGCLQELQQSYQEVGGELLIFQGNPVQVIPQLAATLKAEAVFWNRDVEPYAKERDRQVKAALKEKGIAAYESWDQLLHAPGEIMTKGDSPYKVYGPFWKNWQSKDKAQPKETVANLQELTDQEKAQVKEIGLINLPSAKDLGYVWENPLPLEPGETAARERLTEFCDNALWSYQEQRDLPSIEGTSLLSAALKFGAIGIREVWQAAANAYNLSRSDESRQNIEVWQKELAWREFYHHVMFFFPELAEGPYRDEFKNFPWDNNEDYFQAWCAGKTGYPIVDAAMRQLNETGWMHNRCRMIVASFLTKDLIIDWRWGEKYFAQKLYDWDLSANNGGWQWSASSGMDPKPLRIFNPASQAQKYDPEGEYIRSWVTELSSLEPEYLVTGKIPASERDYCDYPAPIVDHKKQQRIFKNIYNQQKKL